MKIVSLISQTTYTPSQLEKLQSLGEFSHYDVNRIEKQEIIEKVGGADILMVSSSAVTRLTTKIFVSCPNLKYIAVMGAGTDFVDIPAAVEHKILVSNIKGGNSQSVAEHTWGMILSLSKRITESHVGTHLGQSQFFHYRGRELLGKTIGIIGFGEIGHRVATIASGFNMKILSYTRHPQPTQHIEFTDLSTLLKQSDVIVIATPLSDETRDLISYDEFELMKEEVILVNPARVHIIDQEAVLEALENNKLFGFAMELDINTRPDDRFYNYANVLLTPHNAFFTHESQLRTVELGIENVIKYIEGSPQNLVT